MSRTVVGMRYFLDTEFLDTTAGTTLISLGLVANDGREFYAVSSEFDSEAVAASPWLAEHVLPYLIEPGAPVPVSLAQMAEDLEAFCTSCDDGRRPEVWAWNGPYDFYLFAKLWGRLVAVPKVVPTRFLDLKQWAWQLGNVSVPAQADGNHHALADARHDRDTWSWLAEFESGRRRRRDERVRGMALTAATAAIKGIDLP